jgi:hypothetical protein
MVGLLQLAVRSFHLSGVLSVRAHDWKNIEEQKMCRQQEHCDFVIPKFFKEMQHYPIFEIEDFG